MSLNAPIVQPEPFAPVAKLERRIAELEALNRALIEDQNALCNQIANKCQEIATLRAVAEGILRECNEERAQWSLTRTVFVELVGQLRHMTLDGRTLKLASNAAAVLNMAGVRISWPVPAATASRSAKVSA